MLEVNEGSSRLLTLARLITVLCQELTKSQAKTQPDFFFIIQMLHDDDRSTKVKTGLQNLATHIKHVLDG